MKRLKPYKDFMLSLRLTRQVDLQACWQAFSRRFMEVVSAFGALGTSEKLEADTERAIETFVCQLHEPGSTVVHVGDLRWKLFTKKRLQAEQVAQLWQRDRASSAISRKRG